MSNRFPIVVLCAVFTAQSSYLPFGSIGCCLAFPQHPFSLSSSAANPTSPPIGYGGRGLGGDVDLLPNVIWPWIASAKHVALTFGSHFIFTFDGRLYRLPESISPDCRHTLMRDTYDDRRVSSTLIGSRNSLTIIARQLTVSIDEHYQVKVNNTNLVRDLPLTSWDGRILVSREASWISVESLDGGYMTTCSPLAKICMVILSTRFEGHSLGLLGTNDGNASNDFLLRSGKDSDNMRSFFNSYEVTGLVHCLNGSIEDNTTGNRQTPVDEQEEEEEAEDERETDERQQEEEEEQRSCERRYVSACEDLFNSQRSTLSQCYSKINPTPFLNACRLGMVDSCSRQLQSQRLTNASDNDFCYLAFTYSLLCSLRPTDGVDASSAYATNTSSFSSYHASQILLRVPDGCLGCPSSPADVMQSLQPTRKKVDMVVVVSGMKSTRRTGGHRIGQALKHLLHELREALRTDHRIHDLRFGLVTHDDRMRPFSHTLKGLLFGTDHSHSLLESRLINLDTNAGSPSYLAAAAAAANHTQYTTTDALKLALKYPLRALAVKQLLLVTASANHTETNELERISQESLRRGIQLNLWSFSGNQNNSSALHRLVETTEGSVFHVTRSSRQSIGATYRQISRHIVQQIASRMRQCLRCSTTCSPLGILDDLHCQPVHDGPC